MTEDKTNTFAENIQESFEHSVIAAVRKGDWFTCNYKSRMELTSEHVKHLYDNVDMDRVYAIVSDKIEQKIADSMMNSMASEIATDIKQIMCNNELREDCRASLRTVFRKYEKK